MKRFWLGVGILVLFLAIGLLTTQGFQALFQPLSDTLHQASDAVQEGKWEQAEALAQKARQQWDKYRNITAALTNHEPMEETEAMFNVLDVYVRQRDKTRFAQCCAQLAALTEAIGESQSICWWNLL